MTKTMTLSVDESQTVRGAIEKRVSSLGYTTSALRPKSVARQDAATREPDACGCCHDHDRGHPHTALLFVGLCIVLANLIQAALTLSLSVATVLQATLGEPYRDNRRRVRRWLGTCRRVETTL